MGRIEKIRKSLEMTLEHERVVGSLTPDEEEYKDHISFLLSRLQIAKEALSSLNQVMPFDQQCPTDLIEAKMKSVTSGMEMQILNEQLNRINQMNAAISKCGQALEQIRKD